MTESILIAKDGPVTTITINCPHKRNAIDGPTATALRAAFESFETDPAQQVAVLCGAGGNFCAGADLKAMGNPHLGNVIDPAGALPGPLGPTRMLFTKPVIAAVTGYAVAGGLELALMCDLRVAEVSATFGVFCRRWGVPLIDGGTVRLPRLIGQGRALDMILTGRPVPADEALQMGLANRVVKEGRAVQAAQRLALELAAFPQQCMNADRLSVYQQWDFDLPAALRNEAAGGYPIVQREAFAGAQRFADGAGRHGDFGSEA